MSLPVFPSSFLRKPTSHIQGEFTLGVAGDAVMKHGIAPGFGSGNREGGQDGRSGGDGRSGRGGADGERDGDGEGELASLEVEYGGVS
jgi:hypothetical protein